MAATGDCSSIHFFDPGFESVISEGLSVKNLDEVLGQYAALEPNSWQTAHLGALLATSSEKLEAVAVNVESAW